MAPHLDAIASRAAALDETGAFPAVDVALLASAGLATAPLPRAEGGEGAGTEAAGLGAILGLLGALGRANLSVGRLFEAHVNVVRLVFRYGGPGHRAMVVEGCRAGALFGLWVTDAPGQVLRREGGVLVGSKGPCSGAGHLGRALVTVTEKDDVRMALVTLTGREAVEPLGPRLHGMRASANGTIRLDGVVVPDAAVFGRDGDYLREPDLSTGAWRTLAVTSGGLDALVDVVRGQLRRRGHDGAPLQRARFGEMLIAQETVRLWTRRAAEVAEQGEAPVADQVAYVNLARIAVEGACLDAMRHAQRALGLGALLRPHPAERLVRDLATYLRQPAPDDVLTEAAGHALAGP